MRETQILRGLRRGQVLHAANGVVLANSGIHSFSTETPSLMQPMSLRRAFAGMPNRAAGGAYEPVPFNNTAGAGQGLRGQETVPMGMPNRPTGAAYNPAPSTLSVAPKPVGAPPTPAGLQGASTALPKNFFGDAAGQYAAQNRSNGRPTAETEGVMSNLVGMQEARQAQAKASLTPTMMPDTFSSPQTMGRGLKDPSQPVSPSAQTMHDPVPAAPEPVGLRRGVAKLRGPGTTTSDSIPAKLSKGEAVLPAKTVQAMGADNVARLITSTNGVPPASGLRAGAGYNEGVIPPEADVIGAKAQDLNRPTGAGPTYRAGTGAERIATAADEAAAAARQAATAPHQTKEGWGRAGGGPTADNLGGLGGSTATATQAPKPEGLKAKAAQAYSDLKGGLRGAATTAAETPWYKPAGPGAKVATGAVGLLGKLAYGWNVGDGLLQAAKDTPAEVQSRVPSIDTGNKTGINKFTNAVVDAPGVKNTASALGRIGDAASFGFASKAGRYLADGIANKLRGNDWSYQDPRNVVPEEQPQAASPKAAAGSLAAGQAAPDETMPQVQRPAQLNDIRNVDHEAGTMQVFSAARGLDGKPVWQTVSTPEAKEARGLREATYKQQLDHDAAASRADTARQLAYFQAQNGTDGGGESSAVRTLGDALRAGNLTKSGAALLQGLISNQTSMNTARMSNAATLRGQDMTANTAAGEQGVQRRGQDLTYDAKRRELEWQMGEKNIDRQEQGSKALDEDIKNDPAAYSLVNGEKKFDPAKGAAISKYLSETVPFVQVGNKQMSLQEAYAKAPHAARDARQKASNEFALREFVNDYSKGAVAGKGGVTGRLKILNAPRELSIGDFKNDLHAVDYLKSKLPFMNNQSMQFQGVDGRTITVPLSEILGHENGRAMLEAAGRLIPKQ